LRLYGFGLVEDLLAGDALHVVNLARVLLHALHELLLVVGLEYPTAFTFDSLLHDSPWVVRPDEAIITGRVWGIFGIG
jgi:hypothetical protein